MHETRTYYLGLEAEDFLNSELGRHIIQIRDNIIEDCKTKLMHVDPENTKAIRDLQEQIMIANAAIGWLRDTIQEGNEAKYRMEQQ